MASWTGCFSDIAGAEDVAQIKCLEPLFANIIQAITAFSGIALFIMLLIGGFTFLFSGGDPKKLETAQKTITSAIIGIVIIVASYLLLLTIQEFTGIQLTTFNIDIGPFGP